MWGVIQRLFLKCIKKCNSISYKKEEQENKKQEIVIGVASRRSCSAVDVAALPKKKKTLVCADGFFVFVLSLFTWNLLNAFYSEVDTNITQLACVLWMSTPPLARSQIQIHSFVFGFLFFTNTPKISLWAFVVAFVTARAVRWPFCMASVGMRLSRGRHAGINVQKNKCTSK